MNMNDKADVIADALVACEAELRSRYDEDTISLAKAGIATMIETIIINTMEEGKDTHHHPGKVLCVALALLKAMDIASDHLADAVHREN
jgi:hypothetical protein